MAEGDIDRYTRRWVSVLLALALIAAPMFIELAVNRDYMVLLAFIASPLAGLGAASLILRSFFGFTPRKTGAWASLAGLWAAFTVASLGMTFLGCVGVAASHL